MGYHLPLSGDAVEPIALIKQWKRSEPYPEGALFHHLLEWHLVRGTNPKSGKTMPNRRWSYRNFALVINNGWPTTNYENSPERKLRYWRAGEHVLREDIIVRNMLKVLFDDNPELDDWRDDFIKALEHAQSPKDSEIDRSANFRPSPPSTIPISTPHLIGRENETETLVTALISHESVALLVQGGPGIGKTELTKAVAHHTAIVTQFGERRWFVPLETAKSVDDIQKAIVRALGCDPKLDFQAALSSLQGTQTLLILDNLETPWETAGQREATETMLNELCSVAGLSVVASFRGSDVEGPAWERINLYPLSPDASRALFVNIAGQWAKQDSSLDKFVHALGGVPLAIALVSRRANGGGSLAPLWQEWERIGSDFAKRQGVPESSITSLPYSIELSLNSPRIDETPNAIHLFSFLGYLPAGLSFNDCQSLLGDTAYSAQECLLKTGIATPEIERINLLSPIREHARRHYGLSHEDNRHWVKLFLDRVKSFSVAVQSMSGFSAAAFSYQDISNINEAMLHACINNLEFDMFEYIEPYLQMANALEIDSTSVISYIYNSRDFTPEGSYGFTLLKCIILLNKGELGPALEAAETVYNLCIERDDRLGAAKSLLLAGAILVIVQEYATALEVLRTALKGFEEESDEYGARNAEISIISTLIGMGKIDDARQIIDHYRAFSNRNDNHVEISCNMMFYAACGDFESAEGNDKRADEFYIKSLDCARYIGAVKAEIRMLMLLAERYCKQERYDFANKFAEQALERSESMNEMDIAAEIRKFIKNEILA